MRLILDILGSLLRGVFPTVRFPRGASATHLGWMSERWLSSTARAPDVRDHTRRIRRESGKWLEMAIVFQRGVALPVAMGIVGAAALSAVPTGLMPSATMVVAIAAMTLTIEAAVRWRRAAGPRVDGRPSVGRRSSAPHRRAGDPGCTEITIMSGAREQTLDEAIAGVQGADDAADLLRMDDDGGWRKPLQPMHTDGARHRGREGNVHDRRK